MSKNNGDLGPGVWRTVGGRRIFIKEGQDLSTAMRESGKFDNAIRETPSRKYNDDVSFICKIRGLDAIEKEYGKLKNHDVVLTDERKQHILERRGKKDFDIIMKHMSATLKRYDYLVDDGERNKKGVIYIKKIANDRHCAIFVSLSLSNAKYANSNITGIVLNDRNVERYLSRKIIDKK